MSFVPFDIMVWWYWYLLSVCNYLACFIFQMWYMVFQNTKSWVDLLNAISFSSISSRYGWSLVFFDAVVMLDNLYWSYISIFIPCYNIYLENHALPPKIHLLNYMNVMRITKTKYLILGLILHPPSVMGLSFSLTLKLYLLISSLPTSQAQKRMY